MLNAKQRKTVSDAHIFVSQFLHAYILITHAHTHTQNQPEMYLKPEERT